MKAVENAGDEIENTLTEKDVSDEVIYSLHDDLIQEDYYTDKLATIKEALKFTYDPSATEVTFGAEEIGKGVTVKK